MTFSHSKAALLIFAALSFSAAAKACVTAPFVETWANSGVVEWFDDSGDCRFDASVTEASPSAATVHYRRASPQQPLRMSFVVDPHLTSMAGGQSATLASGTASKVPVAGPFKARLFEVSLVGSGGGMDPRIGITAACHQDAVPQGVCLAIASVPFADFPLRITIDVSVGAGSAGQVQVWLGEDVSGTPTLSLDDLDNERWEGIDRVSVGLSDVSASLFAAIGTQPFTFSEITVSDPQLFWNGFEDDVIGSVAVNGFDLSNIPTSFSGSTCGGSVELPVIASGSTRLGGPTAIHLLTVPGGNVRWVELSSPLFYMSLFICPLGSGPSGPCVQASGNEGMVQVSVPGNFPTQSQYQLVIGSLAQECGTYELLVGGTLGGMEKARP